jgi:hypothetical protein
MADDDEFPMEFEAFEEQALPEDVSDLREVIEYVDETVHLRATECSSLEDQDALWMQKFPQR